MSNRKFKQVSAEEAKRIQYDIPLWFNDRGRGMRRSMFSPETRRNWPTDIKDPMSLAWDVTWYIEVANNDNPEYE